MYISKVHDGGFHAREIFMCEVTGRVKALQHETPLELINNSISNDRVSFILSID